jgi:hypothetical protein
MKKYFLYLLIIISTTLTVPVFAETQVNSGFIPGQIWYSKIDLVEGDTVNIHTAIWNGEKEILSAKVEFYDKNVILGSRDVTLASLELKDVYVPWKITAGDHVISAKIISSLATVSGKKENIELDRVTTSNDKQFVSVLVKDSDGVPVKSPDSLLQNQIDKTSSEINKIIPEKLSTSFSNGFTSLDSLRDKTYTQVSDQKIETQKEINQMNMKSYNKTVAQSLDEKSNLEDATKKPITYIKLFLLTALSFVLANKIVFYGILLFIIFIILRAIFRKI